MLPLLPNFNIPRDISYVFSPSAVNISFYKMGSGFSTSPFNSKDFTGTPVWTLVHMISSLFFYQREAETKIQVRQSNSGPRGSCLSFSHSRSLCFCFLFLYLFPYVCNPYTPPASSLRHRLAISFPLQNFSYTACHLFPYVYTSCMHHLHNFSLSFVFPSLYLMAGSQKIGCKVFCFFFYL